MFIHFDLPCDRKMQHKLHQMFRHKIAEWKKVGLVSRAILTYHYHTPSVSSDSLYVCLELPTVTGEAAEEKLSRETIAGIPSQISEFFDRVCKENHVSCKAIGYITEIQRAKRSCEQRGETYYDGAPIEETIRFASLGTEIAMEVLDLLETGRAPWSQDSELSEFIFSRLRRELGPDYGWMNRALHFVCNPLDIQDRAVNSPNNGNTVLTFIRKDFT
jgi:hypothetical protein